MTNPPSPWLIDRGLATDLAAAIGWADGDGIPDLVAALGTRVPAGNTAKLAAMACGEIPPGAGPASVAREFVDLTGSGAPMPAWSCWVSATLMAALAETLEVARVTVVATRRTNTGPGEVDFHSTVLANDGDATWLCDPFFVTSLAGPGCDESESTRDGVWAKRDDGPDGRWSYQMGNGRWPEPMEFRLFAPVLEPEDVLMLCSLSVTHSGVPNRPGARLWGQTIVDIWEREDGVFTCREWWWDQPGNVWEGRLETVELESWAAATAEMTTRTGIPIL